MAGQKELVQVVAEQMGVPIESVTVIDRFLAEAGLRTRAKRGRGYTPMTYQDAANLIIATALGGGPKDAVQQVTGYRSLAARRVAESAFVSACGLGDTFGMALANMIESVAASREEFSAHEDAPNHMSAQVILYGPDPRAEIVLVRAVGVSTFEFGPMFSKPGDLQRTVHFSQITLGFVGEAISADFPETVPNRSS
ncbi:hypothetical protein [Mesorhizobium cantuariense]|uniref:HTH merR-type domain-containing protein n=1 Tax=Mesorhizobium cantuariense TaxID=1300275 RepID=A0ABV7MX40_9HYPH